MFLIRNSRIDHYVLLLVVGVCLFLPSLGAPSLWDIDEGNNAECSREMLGAETWITPTFNGKLRVDKPALLYWLQMEAYRVFGIGEWAARLPSALAALATVLLTCALGRRMFDAGSGLLAGLILASTLLFCGSAHFANPDALLNLCTVLTFLIGWVCFQQSERDWPVLTGLSCGLGFLAKGPVALVLPLTVIGLYLLWSRQLRRLLSPQVLIGSVLFGLVAVPWFAFVGAETKGEYLRGFFLTHNRDRFLGAMEGHRGPVCYHVLSLLLGFLPWSAFLIPAGAYAIHRARTMEERTARNSPFKFLACWIGVYFVFFSLSQTKLPGYILPIYPAVALLMGHYLERWRRGATEPARSGMNVSLACWALLGVGTAVGLLVMSGTVELPLLRGRRFPGLEAGAYLGALPLLGAAAAWLCLRRQTRNGVLLSLGSSAVLFVAAAAIWFTAALDDFKAPRALVEEAQARHDREEVHIGCYEWYQPSLVFYCRREVELLPHECDALAHLECPLPAFLFLPAPAWERLESKVATPCRLVARHWDLYRNCEVVVISNR
jgi:hypothetical protein